MISFNFSFVVFRFKNKHNFVIVLLLLVAEAHYTRTKWCAALCVFFYTIQSTTLYSYEYKNWQNALGIVYTWPCVYIFYKKNCLFASFFRFVVWAVFVIVIVTMFGYFCLRSCFAVAFSFYWKESITCRF